MSTPLSRVEAEHVLKWLGLPAPAPLTRAWLDALLVAYTTRVPWESASRIVRRAATAEDAACVAAPGAFWHEARTRGTGGTCFESNAALAALLEALGVPVIRTINDRPPTPASHTALLVDAEGDRLVVDAGFPLYAALPLPRAGETRTVQTRWGQFSAAPMPGGDARFLITQHPHPRPVAFELVARPVSVEAYAAATCADYGAGGLFLDRVVVKKLVGGEMWRFADLDRPWRLERFRDGGRTEHPLPERLEAAADAIARHFGIDAAIIGQALSLVPAAGAGGGAVDPAAGGGPSYTPAST